MNTGSTRRLVALALWAVAILLPAPVQLQGPGTTPRMPAEYYKSIEFFRTLSAEELLLWLGLRTEELDRTLAGRNGPFWGRAPDHFDAYVRNLETDIGNFRAALGERGVRPPGTFVPRADPAPAAGTAAGGSASGGRAGSATQQMAGPRAPGTTQQIQAPQGRSTSQYAATGVTLFMGAGELAECGVDGLSLRECMERFALRTTTGLLATGAVAVSIFAVGPGALGPSAIVATGVGLASAAGQIVIALEQAGANQNLTAQQQANADRIDQARMDEMVRGLRERIAAAPRPESTTLDQAVSALNRVVEQARAEFNAFGPLNEQTRRASAVCVDRARQPLAFAAMADERLRVMERDTVALERAVAEASALTASCTNRANANQARQLYAGARANLDGLERAGDDARADLRDALGFFGSLRLARASMLDAARRIAALERHLATALAARSRVREALATYAAERAAHDDAMTGVLVSVWNLQRALPGVPPKHIADGFGAIDAAVTAEIGNVLPSSRLTAMGQAADEQITRVDGWVRLAKEQYDDLGACGTLAGDVPEPLQRDLDRIATAVVSTYGRAAKAVENGSTIPGRADACLARLGPETGSGALAGTWRLVGVPRVPRYAPMAGIVTVTSVSPEIGRRLAAEPNWGLASNYACRGMPEGTHYYSGTIRWDTGSFFDRSNVYMTAGDSTMVLCAAGAGATTARGNFRDSNQAHGAFIQWSGTSGSIATESVEGPDSGQTFTVTRR